MNILVIVAFVAILGSLAAALVFMMRGSSGENDGQRSRNMARALTARIGLSVLLFLVVLFSWWMGWIQPKTSGRGNVIHSKLQGHLSGQKRIVRQWIVHGVIDLQDAHATGTRGTCLCERPRQYHTPCGQGWSPTGIDRLLTKACGSTKRALLNVHTRNGIQQWFGIGEGGGGAESSGLYR